jgi:hypothetical protein
MFVVRCSLFVVRCSLFVVRCSLFVVRCSLFVVSCSLFGVRCSLFVVRCSLFVVRCSLEKRKRFSLFPKRWTKNDNRLTLDARRKSSHYLKAVRISKAKLANTLPILTTSAVFILWTCGFSGTTICEPGVTFG